MKQKIRFKDVVWYIKVAVVMGWLTIAYLLIMFLYGFYLGMTGAV